MIPYCSRTGTLSTLAKLAASPANWRLLVCATGRWYHHGFQYGVDNGAFTAHNKGQPFDVEAFLGVLDWTKEQHPPDWIVVPDILGSPESLDFSRKWLSKVQQFTPLPLVAVQDGMMPGDVEDLVVKQKCGIFLGGTTEYKISNISRWGEFCRKHRAYYHVGRVNSQRRIRMCAAAGADSVDGTSVARFPSTLRKLDNAFTQRELFSQGEITEALPRRSSKAMTERM
jgi:hypothetical protein